ncbi:MAG: flagellar hook-associated protein FlgK [Gammaproteobacteria bacterium]|nr:flagellar hook-associated protein FlgK [Gammaproteobacteria bacterium]
MADLLRIATSGLVAYQGALATAGHNVSNASVEGYSRQRAEFATQPAQFLSGSYIGNGVLLDSVTRVVDEFVTSQLRTDAWVYNQADTLRFYNEQIDSILADPDVGLSKRIDSFFNSVQAASADPRWLPGRQVAVSEAVALQSRFSALYTRLADINSSLNARIDTFADDISGLAGNIARLNQQIEVAVGGVVADQPNDLLDERERYIQQLAEIVDVQVVTQGKSTNLFLGKGQALVVGSLAYKAVSVTDNFDPTRKQLALVLNGASRVVTNDTTGGKLGGVLQFREQVLDESFNAIGRVAIGIADDVNRQNQLGMDLDGDLGGLVFSDVNDPEAARFRARAAADNDPASTGGVRIFIDDPALLTTSNYQLDIGAGGSWQLFRLSDSNIVASGAGPLTDTLVTVDGFTVDLNLSEVPPGNFVAGDSFIIEPTRRGSDTFRAVITRPEDFAFAQPVRVKNDIGNIGDGVIATGTTFDVTTPIFAVPGALTPPLLIRFTSATSYEVRDARTQVVLAPNLPYSPGTTNTLLSTNPGDPDYFGFQLTLSGSPVTGDRFNVQYNTGGTADNSNGLALAALQTADRLAGGSASYQSAYGELAGFVGTVTRQSRIETDAGKALLEQTSQTRESISGVNLDEEAANLIRFEQAYNASAQVIAIARSTIESLFDAFR